MIIMEKIIKHKYYTVENGVKNFEWVARDIKTKEIIKEFENMQEALKFVNNNENAELYNRTLKQVFEFIKR